MSRTEQTIEAIKKLNNGKRIYIQDVAELTGMTGKREAGFLSAILFRLEAEGSLTLYKLDNPQERPGKMVITTTTGQLRHIIYA